MSLAWLLKTLVPLLMLHSPMRVEYVLSVDSATAPDFRVEMRLFGAPETLRLAMAAHPEYDDRYWRYLRDLQVQSEGHDVAVVREDSAIWRASISAGEAVIRYRIVPPSYSGGRGSWQAYLSPTGGLVGGPHSFLYVIGQESAPSRVTLRLPAGWRSATGLSAKNDSVYQAANVAQLLDSPILIGEFLRRRFVVGGVTHDVVYAAGARSTPLDTLTLTTGLERLVRASRDVFGGFPYAHFDFLLEEGAYGGGLEHESSVTLGISAAELPRAPAMFFSGAAHEYFHVWNEVHLRPRGWGGVTTRPPAHTREMWWMEGVTMYYSDVLARRAHLPVERASRAAQLAYEIGRYLDNPSNALVSPEQASWWSGDAPGSHGSLLPDFYLQGRLLGAMLDLVVRDSTDSRRSLDDVMRALFVQDSGRGYSGADIQHTAERACRCSLDAFFETQVRRAGAIDFERWLGAAGLRMTVAMSPATDSAGNALADARIGAYVVASDPTPRLLVVQPEGIWRSAGLRTGDIVRGWNGAPVTLRELRARLRAEQVGDTVSIQYERAGATSTVRVPILGYSEHVVRLTSLPHPTMRQLRVRRGAMLDIVP